MTAAVSGDADSGANSLRADKWLWAARWFKTRALAVEALNGGKVHVNGIRVKPSRPLHVGDELRIRRSFDEYVVHVRALSARRGPAADARQLYEETAASIAAREQLAEQRKLQAPSVAHPDRRPDKRARRQIVRFTRKSD